MAFHPDVADDPAVAPSAAPSAAPVFDPAVGPAVGPAVVLCGWGCPWRHFRDPRGSCPCPFRACWAVCSCVRRGAGRMRIAQRAAADGGEAQEAVPVPVAEGDVCLGRAAEPAPAAADSSSHVAGAVGQMAPRQTVVGAGQRNTAGEGKDRGRVVVVEERQLGRTAVAAVAVHRHEDTAAVVRTGVVGRTAEGAGRVADSGRMVVAAAAAAARGSLWQTEEGPGTRDEGGRHDGQKGAGGWPAGRQGACRTLPAVVAFALGEVGSG